MCVMGTPIVLLQNKVMHEHRHEFGCQATRIPIPFKMIHDFRSGLATVFVQDQPRFLNRGILAISCLYN